MNLQNTSSTSSFPPLKPVHFVVPLFIVIALWLAFYLEFKSGTDWGRYGVLPGDLEGLWGVFSMPLIHADLTHLINNSIPAYILSAMIFYFYGRLLWPVLGVSWILSGLFVWFFGRENYHIGFSGIVYSLAYFTFISGLLRRHPRLMATSMIVAFLYGSMVWGIFPVEERISWEGHLGGAISGVLMAVILYPFGLRKAPLPEPEEEELPQWWLDMQEEQNHSGDERQQSFHITYTFKPKSDSDKSD